MSFSYQALTGLSNLDASSLITDVIVTDELTTDSFTLPPGAVDGYILTSDSGGKARWLPDTSLSLTLGGDATGPLLTNQINTLANGTIAVSNLVTLDATQILRNKSVVGNFWGDLVGNSTTATRVTMNGQVTGLSNQTVIANNAVLTKVLTGFISAPGTILETDNILQAIQKLNGNTASSSSGVSTATANTLALRDGAAGCSFANLTASMLLQSGTLLPLIAADNSNLWMGLAGKTGAVGTGNIGIGTNVLFNGIGTDNLVIGRANLASAGSCDNNASVGINSMVYNNTGSSNTALGNHSLVNNTDGNNNTAIGYSSCSLNSTGSSNTSVGFGSGVASAALSNTTSIGNGARCSASNTIQLGNDSITNTLASGNITLTGSTSCIQANSGNTTLAGFSGNNGNYFTDAAAGDSAYRNLSGSLRFGTSAGTSQLQITPSGVNTSGNLTVSGFLTVAGGSKGKMFSITGGTSINMSAADSGSFFRIGSGRTLTLPSPNVNVGVYYTIASDNGTGYVNSGGALIKGYVFSSAGVMSLKNAANLSCTVTNSVISIICDGSGWVVESSFGWT